MRSRILQLFWDSDGNNANHLWQSHRVSTEEIEDVLLGIDGEEPDFDWFSDSNYYKAYGKTSGGRLIKIVGEFRFRARR